MSDEEYELTPQEQIHKALADINAQRGALVNRWVLVIETLDEDGKDIDFISSDSIETWEAIGLLRTVQVVLEDRAAFEAAAANANWGEDDDED